MIIQGNALHIPLADRGVQCVVTSPPYYGLRNYGVSGQLGLESTPDEYVANMVQVFREVKRVLKDNGVAWLNLGDSYGGSGMGLSYAGFTQGPNAIDTRPLDMRPAVGHKRGKYNKQLLGIPWRVAFALQEDGWYLRSDIIWQKPNPMPESVKDRPTRSHEYVFLLTKSARYYYDNEAIFEPASKTSIDRINYGWNCDRVNISPDGNGSVHTDKMGDRWLSKRRGFKTKDQLPDNQHHGADIQSSRKQDNTGNSTYTGFNDRYRDNHPEGLPARNKRSVWTISTQPTAFAHFAVMPEKLVEPCILAGSKPGDIIFDPFAGSGTVERVAIRLGRESIGLELNFNYIADIAKRRTSQVQVRLPIDGD